jgi:hypothetical protein
MEHTTTVLLQNGAHTPDVRAYPGILSASDREAYLDGLSAVEGMRVSFYVLHVYADCHTPEGLPEIRVFSAGKWSRF